MPRIRGSYVGGSWTAGSRCYISLRSQQLPTSGDHPQITEDMLFFFTFPALR